MAEALVELVGIVLVVGFAVVVEVAEVDAASSWGGIEKDEGPHTLFSC